jgi:hypothetical protein
MRSQNQLIFSLKMGLAQSVKKSPDFVGPKEPFRRSQLRAQTTSTYLSSTLTLSSRPPTQSLSYFPTKILFVFVTTPMRATCPAYSIFFKFNYLMISGEDHKLRSPSLCSFLHPPVTSSLFDPNALRPDSFRNF